MPQIPGVSVASAAKPGVGSGVWLVVGGLVAVLVAVLVGGKVFSKSRRTDASSLSAQPDISAPVADLAPAVPKVPDPNPVIASISELKPWDSREFMFRDPASGANVPAMLIRLPTGAPGQSSAYWSFALRAAYGTCQLEYVADLQKVRDDYGFRAAKHPMVGNPCSRSLYDPLKYASLSGNVLARGAVVQGTDLRPPLGIETKVRGKDILAVRME